MARQLPLFACVLLWMPRPTDAQAIEGLVGRSWSAYHKLGSPVVAGAELQSFRVVGLYLRFGMRRAWDHTTVAGVTCDTGFPTYEGCVDEPVRTDLTMTSQWFGVGYELIRGVTSFEFSLRRTRHQLAADVHGLNTGRSDLEWIPSDTIETWGFDLGVGRSLWFAKHMRVKLVCSIDPTDIKGCATGVGTPFCGGGTVHMVSVGIALGT